MSLFQRLYRWPTLSTITVLHALWGVVLNTNLRAVHITALTPLSFGGSGTTRAIAMILMAIAGMGVWALTRRDLSWATLAALMPQQTVLALSAASGIYFTIAGRYGDGVIRSHSFIGMDQAPIILMAIVHSSVLIAAHRQALAHKKETQ